MRCFLKRKNCVLFSSDFLLVSVSILIRISRKMLRLAGSNLRVIVARYEGTNLATSGTTGMVFLELLLNFKFAFTRLLTLIL